MKKIISLWMDCEAVKGTLLSLLLECVSLGCRQEFMRMLGDQSSVCGWTMSVPIAENSIRRDRDLIHE